LLAGRLRHPGAAPGIDRAEVPESPYRRRRLVAWRRRPAPPVKFGGGYKDDGPGDNPPDIDAIPDAVPRPEPLHRFANNPYSALGRDYVPRREHKPYTGRGIGSWYGKRYHGQKTSSGEIYDMYGDDGGASDTADPVLRPRHQSGQRPFGGGAHQRPRALPCRTRNRLCHGLPRPSWATSARAAPWSRSKACCRGRCCAGVVGKRRARHARAAKPAPALAPPARPASEDDPIARLAAAEAEPPLPQVQDARGHFLQLGAFGNRDNAESLRTRLARELGELGGKLVVQSTGNLFRVQLGPWPDAAAAQLASGRLRDTLGLSPVVVQR
jgi:rare lipoprotein A